MSSTSTFCNSNRGGEHVFIFRSPPHRIEKAIISRLFCIKCNQIYDDLNSVENHVHVYEMPDKNGDMFCCSPIIRKNPRVTHICGEICPYDIKKSIEPDLPDRISEG